MNAMKNQSQDLGRALLTDLYQLTMARGHWKAGRLGAEGTFLLAYRRAPFGGTFALAAGVGEAMKALDGLRFGAADIEALRALPGPVPGEPLFEAEFVDLLEGLNGFDLEIEAVPDGAVVLPGVPMVRVTGPLWQAQLVETLLLNMIGFETLIATKAARIVRAAGNGPVLEFGARRAQGEGASISAARAAWIGGVAGTSNVLAAAQLGIPVRGTHAHAWVQSFAGEGPAALTEARAFGTFAESMPAGCVLLVDTYDTEAGIENAIRTARAMRAKGHELSGIRLDSGDLVAESQHARRAFDEAGFPDVKVVASDDLDEHKIEELLREGAAIDVWGVGTRLVTGGEQAALGVVYKLSAVREGPNEEWRPVMKLSSNPAKRSIPGRGHVTRFVQDGQLKGDAIGLDARDAASLGGVPEPLLQPAIRGGRRLASFPVDLQVARERAVLDLARVPAGARALKNPEAIAVEISPELEALRERLVRSALAQGETA